MSFGLLGEHLGHSYSPMIYKILGLHDYKLFSMPENYVENFIKSSNLKGLNVTIPYKKMLMGFCDDLSPQAKRLANVNTIIFKKDGSIYGHNTDYAGFLYMIRRADIRLKDKKVLILGSGGAAQTARIACVDEGAKAVIIISRGGKNNYANIKNHIDAEIIINATPIGMYPKNEGIPVSLDIFQGLEAVADLIYNPLRTNLLTQAKARGVKTAGGLSMLAAQGKEAAELFLNESIDENMIAKVCYELQKTYENIALIGMPGAGKTTVGKLLYEKTGRKFIDIDEEIKKKTLMSPKEWIINKGEKAFRDIESEVLKSFAAESSLIIATGGGAILKKENRVALNRNSRVYWLDRNISDLPKEGRPLSFDLEKLYNERKDLYEKTADVIVNCQKPLNHIIKEIEEDFYASISSQWS